MGLIRRRKRKMTVQTIRIARPRRKKRDQVKKTKRRIEVDRVTKIRVDRVIEIEIESARIRENEGEEKRTRRTRRRKTREKRMTKERGLMTPMMGRKERRMKRKTKRKMTRGSVTIRPTQI